jgi:outer membrane protein assembly factor BamB
MQQRAGEHVMTVAAVLIGVCVAGSGALHFHLHAIGPEVVVVSGADTCSTPVHGEQPYAYSLPGGALRWRRRFHGACDDFDPVDPVSDGIVAVYAARGLEAWSVANGSTRWRTSPVQFTPRQTDDAIVGVDSNTGAVSFLDPRSGRVRQSGVAQFKPYPWFLTPDEAIMLTQSTNGPGFEDQLTASDTASGRRLWRHTLGASGGAGGNGNGADGVVVVGRQGATAAFDARSGRRLWVRRGAGDLQAVGSELALFVHGHTLEADDLRTGTRRWERRLVSWRAGGYSKIAAGGGSVAVVDQDRVRVLRAKDGSTRWSRPLATARLGGHGPAVISGGLLVIPASSSAYTPCDE